MSAGGSTEERSGLSWPGTDYRKPHRGLDPFFHHQQPEVRVHSTWALVMGAHFDGTSHHRTALLRR